MKEKEITNTLHLLKPQKSQVPGIIGNHVGYEEPSIGDLFSKAFRHKTLMLSVIMFVLAISVAAYAIKGTWYSRVNTFQFNNFENNALFFTMDTIVPDQGDTRRSDNKQEYASRAVSVLTSDDFLAFVYDVAKEDQKLAKLFESQGIGIASQPSAEDWDKLRTFFDQTVKISAPQGGGGILKLQNTGFFLTEFKNADRGFVDVFSVELSRLMNQYLSKKEIEDIRATRQIVGERLELFKKEITALNERRTQLIAAVPPLSAGSYDVIALELEKAKASMMGNRLTEQRLGKLFRELELTVKALNEGAVAEDDTAENLDWELQRTLAQLKEVVRGNSTQLFGLNNFRETASVANKYDTKKTNTLILKSQFEYEKARVDALETALMKVREQLNKRATINNEIEDIVKQIASKQRLADSMETSKVRLDFADFKTLRRVEVFKGPIIFKSIMPIGAFGFLSFAFAIVLSFLIAFAAERQNPSLTQVKTFEELNVPVLGAVPSTKNYIVGHSMSLSSDDPNAASYVKLAINLGNILTFMHSKIALFSGHDSSVQSATVVYNLSTYFARTGRRVLMIEADLKQGTLNHMLGVSGSGGLEGVLSTSTEVNISPVKIEERLHLLSGSTTGLPEVYRLVSEGFLGLLTELKNEYDLIIIHAPPCLESSDAADLSRYAGVSLVCLDANTIRVGALDRLMSETKSFLSKYFFFIVENAEDRSMSKSRSSRFVGKKRGTPPSQDTALRKAG